MNDSVQLLDSVQTTSALPLLFVYTTCILLAYDLNHNKSPRVLPDLVSKVHFLSHFLSSIITQLFCLQYFPWSSLNLVLAGWQAIFLCHCNFCSIELLGLKGVVTAQTRKGIPIYKVNIHGIVSAQFVSSIYSTSMYSIMKQNEQTSI